MQPQAETPQHHTQRPQTPERPQRALLDEEIEAYRRDGVVCLRQVVPPHWMEKIRAGVLRAIHHPSPFSRLTFLSEFGLQHGTLPLEARR